MVTMAAFLLLGAIAAAPVVIKWVIDVDDAIERRHNARDRQIKGKAV